MKMQKIVGLFFLGMLVSTQLFSQTWARMQSWGLDLEAIIWVDENVGYSVGENLIIKTADGGTTWQELQVSYEGKLLDVAFWDESTGVAVGENGLILKTQNAGNSWASIPSGITQSLKNVEIASENKILAISEGGQILVSNNKGETWAQQTSGTTQSLNNLSFVNTDTAYIAGDQGVILRTYNGGSQWSTLNSGLSSNLNGIAFSTSLLGYAVGDAGIILKTLDGGENWLPQTSPVTTDLKKVAISPLDNRIVAIVGDSATALRSTNSGATFGKANLGTTNIRNVKGLHFKPASNLVYAVGQDGYMISSTNAGSSYTQRLAGIRNDFSGIDFKTDRVGHIIGQQGAVYVTSNGATTVVSRPINEPLDLVGLDYWNNSFGYVGSNAGKIFRTSNSGSTWVPVPAQTAETITGFYLFAPSVLYVTGTNGYIARSFDSGGTWDAAGIQTNTTENLRDVTYFDYQVGFAMGDNGQISWTNGGNTWENLPKLTSENLNALSKLDSSTAIIVGDAGVILKSEDMAKTWRKIDVPYTENFTSVDFWDNYLGFISGENGLILQTKDGGESWIQIPTGTGRNLSGVSVGTPTVAFAVGDDGTILRYECIQPTDLSEIIGEGQLCQTIGQYAITDAAIPGAQLVWRVDGGEIISGQGTSEIEVLWNTPGRNGVFVSMENFCGNGSTSSLEVIVSASPTSTIQISGNGSVCMEDVELYSVPNQSGITYTWEINGGEITQGQGTSQIHVKWNTSGSQRIALIQENQCGKADPVEKPISVNMPPDQPGEIQGEIQTGLWQVEYSVPIQESVNFKWSISNEGGSILQGQGTEKVTVLWEKEGDFQLSVTPENECNNGVARILNVNVNVITALPEKEDLNVNIFPNPSSGAIKVQLGAGNYKSIQVINAFGHIIQSIDLANGTKEITLENLPRGMNLIQLHTESSVVIRKVIVN
ncbi:YCF48-related protein [Algoriphagus winogradskyi]|uniref:Por secretion system C-terminal sorting domain-containing protein n=1 Tax=Algoriphagus winogradskyi TaxID=237017 RepID=A0ABY1NMS6_9BACT|nr:YCF48-related protein [Algoriphagus winogradskyi]SMP13564.1 Por secretion system C-terminal sorting domain-containing protein [Algoriphagus winogradskyi]